MEYNPVAINEVLAFSYRYVPAGATAPTGLANRFFMELVNTQTAPETSLLTSAGFNAGISLGGYVYNAGEAIAATPDPYPGAPWDIVFTADDPYSRPDPYRGQLVPYGNTYAATPLCQSTFSPPTPAPPAGSVPNNPPTNVPPGTPTDGYDVVLPRFNKVPVRRVYRVRSRLVPRCRAERRPCRAITFT